MTQKQILRLSLALAASLLVFATDSARAAEASPGEVTLNLAGTKEHARNSEGAFATLASGRIIFCYSQFGDAGDDNSPSRIVCIHSDDQGRTWGQPEALAESKSGSNVMSVSLLRLAHGQLALFYLVKNSWIDCRPYMRLSSDEGATWTEAKRVLDAPGYFVMNNDRVIQTRTGRILIPLAFHRARGEDPNTAKSWDIRGIALWIYSDDDGATWQESSSWWAMPAPSARGLQEPGVVGLADGSLFSWCRTDQGSQYGFRSTDNGKTWTPPGPTELKSPTAPASIKRWPGSDDLLALYNDHSGRFPFTRGKRTPFVAAISSDGGKTWSHHKAVEDAPDGGYCYTAIHFVGDAVLLGYCAGDSKLGTLNRLRIRRIPLEWFREP